MGRQMTNVTKITGKGQPEPERTIGDMATGETGYTVPWALRDGRLLRYYSVWPDKEGTVTMRVTRVGQDEYHVHFEDEPSS